MNRRGAVLLALALAGACAVLAVPVLMFMVVVGGSTDPDETCSPSSPDVMLAANTSGSALSRTQLANAATIIAVGNQLGVPRQGLIVALAVASQESRFLNYANDGEGGDLQILQLGIGASLALPHEAVGTDHGSLGVFQQQWPWWGTMEQLMDPAVAAEKFYTALLKVPGWERMSVTGAGQAVQNSAYPEAYADDAALAERLLEDPDMASADITNASFGADAQCVPGATYPGAVAFPLPGGASYVDRANWGNSGSNWSRVHTGTDFSAPCGTPVLAATNGTVIVRTDQPWSGQWLVQVSTGVGRLTTWYAHMEALAVEHGDTVTAGQQIGEVGSEGNSTGCHLHFEVHPRGGSIYADNVDPTAWLAQNVGKSPGVIRPASAESGDFIVATFNVLGHSHTVPGGNKPGYADSGTRMRWAVQLLDANAVDVVGLQEFQRPQKRRMLALAGDRYAVYSPLGDTENSIAWRRARWEFVEADTFAVPYFNGNPRRMPIVRLRDRATGEESIFVNVHNPADTRRFPAQGAHRAEAVRREYALVRQLVERYGVPVLITGDLNDRAPVFCELTAGGLLHAAAGGSTGSPCRPPNFGGIDWIFGTRDMACADHTVLSGSLVSRTTDHPLVLARATR